ncbi:hypothetical protein [Nostoc sp.]
MVPILASDAIALLPNPKDGAIDISEKECRDVAVLRLYKGSG